MNVFRWTAIAAPALLVAACGQRDEAATAANTSAANTSGDVVANDVAGVPSVPASAGQAFANAAAASDTFEIETSKLAQAQAKAPAVKKFAAQMISAHTDSTAKLKAAAASASPAITPDPTLTAEQQQTLDALKSLNGEAFDRAYAAAQADGHQKTLDTLKAYAATGDVPQLKSFATTLVPIVTAHVNLAKTLSR